MILTGTSRNDRLIAGGINTNLLGLGGDDTLYGGAGADTLSGGLGNDLLDGGLGADRMEGGAGNDRFIVDNPGDVVVELAGEGYDRIIASLSWTLGAEVEGLSLSGTADLNGTGNALANRLEGNAGANILDGGEGKDTLCGLAGNDTLIGGGGADLLDGGLGADRMAGGTGNDRYIVDSLGDVVVELAGEGYDRIIASLSLTLGAELEGLTLTGTADLNGTGNALANRLDGNLGVNILDGGEGQDTLYGLAGDDTLIGGGGGDLLDGGLGADSMRGGMGDDRYLIDNIGDRILEQAGQGTDHVLASISWAIGPELERLTLTGTANLNGTGNALANTITGNAGANALDGGAGMDRLMGGSGADTFVFRASTLGVSETGIGAARDLVQDFVQGEDRIDLSAFEGATDLVFRGTGAFVAGAGPQLRYEVIGSQTVLQLDLAGAYGVPDGNADAEIGLTGAFALSLADFAGVSALPVPPPSIIPPGAISIAVGANAQALVDMAPTGATFWFEAGIHRLASIIPKNGQTFLGDDAAVLSGAKLLTGFVQDGNAWVIGGQQQEGERRALGEMTPGFDHAGFPNVVFMDDRPLTAVDTRAELGTGKYFFDYANDRIYLGDNPAGHVIEAATSPFAFAGNAVDVRIEGLTIEKYASPIQYGAIGYKNAPVNWVIEGNEVRLNFGVGIYAGDNTKIIGNYVHNNGEMGLGGNGDNILVADNEIARNGFWSGIDVFWEGGGSKFAETNGLVVRGNFSHDNKGYGLWSDIDNFGTLYENNRLERNSGGGINHEISFNAVIRNNIFEDNGADVPQWLWGAAIQVQNSRDVEIYGNTIDMTDGGNGISLIQQDRGSGPGGQYLTVGNFVHDNVLTAGRPDRGNSGAVADAFEDTMLNGGNRFDRNTYYVTDAADDHWFWGDSYNWATYRAISGQDAGSQVFIA